MNRISRTGLVAALLVLVALVWRVAKVKVEALEPLANFSPVIAVAFVGAALLPRKWAMWVWFPVALTMMGDLFAYGSIGWISALIYGCLIAFSLWGGQLPQRGTSLFGLFGRLVGCVFGFYLVTNLCAWAMDPGYAKSVSGAWQAITVGKPGFPPTWMFLRNSLAGNLLFGAILIAVYGIERFRLRSAAPAGKLAAAHP